MNEDKLKILAIDDELLIRKSIKLAGESRGHIVQAIGTAKTALSVWSSFEPDLAFIDILMPEMDGWELLENIPKNSKAKIIIISAHDKIKKEDMEKRGADLFVKKPFSDIFQLIEQAEKLITKSRGQDEDYWRETEGAEALLLEETAPSASYDR